MKKNQTQFRSTFDLNCFNQENKIVWQARGCYSKEQCLEEWQYILDCQLKNMSWAKRIVRYEIVVGKPAGIPNGKPPFGLNI
jgi:hypothetical protein